MNYHALLLELTDSLHAWPSTRALESFTTKISLYFVHVTNLLKDEREIQENK